MRVTFSSHFFFLLFSFSEQHLNFSIIIFSILSSALLKKENNLFLRNHHCELGLQFKLELSCLDF